MQRKGRDEAFYSNKIGFLETAPIPKTFSSFRENSVVNAAEHKAVLTLRSRKGTVAIEYSRQA
jgi:hypothetical protein